MLNLNKHLTLPLYVNACDLTTPLVLELISPGNLSSFLLTVLWSYLVGTSKSYDCKVSRSFGRGKIYKIILEKGFSYKLGCFPSKVILCPKIEQLF
jgi:hypothetical protein